MVQKVLRLHFATRRKAVVAAPKVPQAARGISKNHRAVKFRKSPRGRPIVCTPKGVRLCRPSEIVLDLLDRLPAGPFHKEDGELLIDHDGRRVA